MTAESLTPWRSARALEVLIFLLLIRDASCFFQLLRFLRASSGDREASMAGREPSDSEPDMACWSAEPSVGLIGRGENVPWLHRTPWLQAPSAECSRYSAPTSPRRDVLSVGGSWGR